MVLERTSATSYRSSGDYRQSVTTMLFARPLFILRPDKLIVFIYLQGIDIR
jgi:hypothetical protein